MLAEDLQRLLALVVGERARRVDQARHGRLVLRAAAVRRQRLGLGE